MAYNIDKPDAIGAATKTLSNVNPTVGKTALGLQNVDNTSDVNKPISSATQTALNAKSNTPVVVSANQQAEVDTVYHNVATATYTDPAVPVEGKGFEVVVRNGTATIGGTAYSQEGLVIRRIFHSGSYGPNQVDQGAVAATDTTAGTVPGIGGTAAGNAATVGQLETGDGYRDAADYLWSDGATSNRGQIQTPGPRGNLAGATLASWVGWVTVPTASSTAEIAGISSSSTALASATAWSLGIAWITNDLVVRANGATPATDFRTFTCSALRTNFSGQRIWLEVRITAGTSAPVVSVNGTVIAGTAADGAGTDPDWLSASLVATNHVTGLNWPAGPAPLGCWINAHLTDAESEAWRITGRPPVWVALGGGVWTEDFTDGQTPTVFIGVGFLCRMFAQTSFTQSIYDLVANPDSLPSHPTGATKAIKFTTSANNGYSWITSETYLRKTVFTVWYYVSSGQPDVQVLGNGIATPNGLVITGARNVKDAWTQITVSITNPTPVGSMLFRTVSAGTAYIADVRGRVESALSLPVVLPIAALGDGTFLGDNPARLVGITPVTTRKDWELTVHTATSGNEQLLGGSFLNAARDVLDSIEQRPETGTPTTTVGSASGGAQYKASGALAAGINTPALVTRKTATANVWVGSSTADPIRTTITGHSV